MQTTHGLVLGLSVFVELLMVRLHKVSHCQFATQKTNNQIKIVIIKIVKIEIVKRQ